MGGLWLLAIRVALLALVVASMRWSHPDGAARWVSEFYLSPDGDDGADGTLQRPWRTLPRALSALAPGDILNLRGGTYYEREVVVDLQGTAEAPITIRSYPGERAVIDGGVPDFRDAPNTEWERVDGAIGLYRSRQALAEGADMVRAWLTDEGVQLVEYGSEENLESRRYGPVDGMRPLYMGPGLQVCGDGHVYIRLAHNPNDLTNAAGEAIAPVPADTDPNHNGIAVSFAPYLLRLDGANHLIVSELDLAHADYVVDARDSHHVRFRGCRFVYGYRGLVAREGVEDWGFDACTFTGGMPDYIYWTDVKNRDQEVAEAYPEFQSAAINGSLPGFAIHHCTFRDTFDGIRVEEGSVGARITHNTFLRVRDDAINLSRGIGDVEVAHNMLWHVMGGIANLASDADPGLHAAVLGDPTFDPATIWERYRPSNRRVAALGAPYAGLDWPGTRGVYYRGAIPPATPAARVTIFMPLLASTMGVGASQ